MNFHFWVVVVVLGSYDRDTILEVGSKVLSDGKSLMSSYEALWTYEVMLQLVICHLACKKSKSWLVKLVVDTIAN